MQPLTNDPLSSYVPHSGLSIPIVTILDREGRILEDQQRAVVRFCIQDGRGADILFAVGTNGEWDRIDNAKRQQAARIIVEECRRVSEREKIRPVEAWIGVTAHTRAETLENLEYSIALNADAAVIAPLSITDVDDVVELVTRDLDAVFARAGKMIPVFLYDNADIAAPGKPQHLHTRDVKQMSQLPYVRGIKVTASKTELGNYTRAASHFKLAHEFVIYAGNAHLIFDLFSPPDGVAATAKHYWNRYLTGHSLPYGVVAGPANAMPREWQRAWQWCRKQDIEQMPRYAKALEEFRDACSFTRSGVAYVAMIACLKAALAEFGVISSDAVANGTPELSGDERRIFADRFQRLRDKWARVLEPEWLSQYDGAAGERVRANQHG
ncbi:MAG TPA: dihydrodipicolinate synthase family protein [Candidatus Binataceae bacterium]|nr:dihydrodipicolinate synthase family protein [Candidatus Binataceae bacterium]